MDLPNFGMIFMAYSCMMSNTTLEPVDLTRVDSCHNIQVFVMLLCDPIIFLDVLCYTTYGAVITSYYSYYITYSMT